MNPIHPSLAPLAVIAKQDPQLLHEPLRAALRDPAWLRPEHRVGDPNAYMRHVLYVDPDGDFVITAITWLPGQQSPMHGHHVWCAFGVAEGELTEERFDARLAPLQTVRYAAGEVAQTAPIHRVANRGGAPLVSLHLYGVSAERLTTGINRIYA